MASTNNSNVVEPTGLGETQPKRHTHLQPDEPLVGPPKGVNSLYDIFYNAVTKYADRPLMGVRPIVDGVAGDFVWSTFEQVYTRVKNFGAGLLQLGFQSEMTLGIFSENRPEWTIAEQASYMHNFTTVPLYATLGAEAVRHTLTEAEITVMCATLEKTQYLLEVGGEALSVLKQIIVMDNQLTPEVETLAKQADVLLYRFQDVEALGEEHPADPTPGNLDSIATICYTSGTTGTPKGAVITHLNILSIFEGVTFLGRHSLFYTVAPEDRYLSYLPLAHALERVILMLFMGAGARVGYYQGSPLKLMDDICTLKPTILMTVPRVLNLVYHKVQAAIKGMDQERKNQFNTAYAAKKDSVVNGTAISSEVETVFKPFRQVLGGELRLVVTGTAPLSNDIMEFLRVVLGTVVAEGYGQTEATSAIALTDIHQLEVGHVGYPYPTVEVKLVDVPELGYTVKDQPFPRGEIYARGTSIFQGYYKNPGQTREALTEDGWVRTGDVGLWDAKGRLVIIDRRKSMFKLAQGEYVAPEKVENFYATHPLVTQIYVTGDSQQSYTVGIIVPEPTVLSLVLQKAGFEAAERPLADLCRDPKVRKIVLDLLTEHVKSSDIKGFERMKAIHLESTPFTPQNGLLSSSMKLKRFTLNRHYADQVKELYAEMNQA
ncbi:medium-chain fatty acid-CoA ligase faa2 [Dispira parvispora]|uniref:Medium-chain fatty acid-CoA ligase faa2 n=1 Tax=Dispira parvispora TaxID=1520584 RepID=A0A9W8E1S5_9FUNG|nr:medium-chain fatty acid-CoA ligase faa2 [Dispira parvispora]